MGIGLCQEKQTPKSELGLWKSAIKVRGEQSSAGRKVGDLQMITEKPQDLNLCVSRTEIVEHSQMAFFESKQ